MFTGISGLNITPQIMLHLKIVGFKARLPLLSFV